jgi:hypothetical protein
VDVNLQGFQNLVGLIKPDLYLQGLKDLAGIAKQQTTNEKTI